MAILDEGALPTLFNGVSRQPTTVRLPGQVQAADNAQFSVVTGGFEKRSATQHVGGLSGAGSGDTYHFIDRSSTEKYIVCITGGSTIKVYNSAGVAQTVNALAADATSYLNPGTLKHVLVSVADYTFVVNRNKTVAMAAAGSGTIDATYQQFSSAPTGGSITDGHIIKIQNDPSQPYGSYYLLGHNDGASSKYWSETVDPNSANSFDATTMPYTLIRKSDGTWDFKKATWASRTCGDSTSVPVPKFVGSTISDVFFHRNRLGFLSDENVFFSRSSDFFNLWPSKATQVLDTDPIDISASSTKVTLLKWAVPFRKSMFLTAEKAQFEITAENILTGKSINIDPTTNYDISPTCRPVTSGDTLYFATEANGASVIWEYFWDQTQFGNTAADITKHCESYVPTSVAQLVAAPATDRLYVRSTASGETDKVYVYTTYWDGDKKAQSAWGRYTFPGATVIAMGLMGDTLYIVMSRSGTIYLETLLTNTELAFPTVNGVPVGPAPVLLDRRVTLTGSYSSGTGLTTFTTPYAHGSDIVAVTTSTYPTYPRRKLVVNSYPTGTTFTVVGNWSNAAGVAVGSLYPLSVELSKQHPRNQNGQAILAGRLQLAHMKFAFRNAGYFEVQVTPEGRATRSRIFNGAKLGNVNVNDPGIIPEGTFRARIGSRADTTKIVIYNNTHLPCTITSASWSGTYSEVSRQEGGR